MPKRVRLHKYIANCGYTSRRRAELLILGGRVEVNGAVVDRLGSTVDPDRDEVVVNGDVLGLPETVTLMLNKPAAIITSTHDTHDRLTVMDLLPKRFRDVGVAPVGRLDRDTEGLLLLTNDGDLHHRIAHPRHEIEKEYEATVKGHPTPEACRRFEEGIVLDGQKTAPARVLSAAREGGSTRLRVVIREGRKRQIRRMFEALAHPVVHLRRVRIGALELGDLPVGRWREIGEAEVEAVLTSPARGSRRASRR